ncbi:rCG32922, isoform CRA_b [Rattus norvegicus]|uniref:RCG32922, isoform CRA_b n=1 Tax=Rattus norvegicus TaxID=10116 RepID=A6HHG5_RAT|nr:rCG32922, isoform CRA_b [Rattus norvegicus]
MKDGPEPEQRGRASHLVEDDYTNCRLRHFLGTPEWFWAESFILTG